MPTTGLTPKEESQLIALMSRVGPSWSQQFYESLAKLVAFTAVETVPLRYSALGRLEVLLTARPVGDMYEGQLHSPGSILRATDESFANALHRVEKSELNASFTDAFYVKSVIHHTPRGTEVSAIHVCLLPDNADVPVGSWYDVDDLPTTVIPHMVDVIKIAAEWYLNNNIVSLI